MRSIKLLFFVPAIYFCFLLSGMSFAGCTKTTTVHDTTIVTQRDTVIQKDTLTIRDTINNCNCNLTDGLVAYFNFNGGNLNDSSGHNNNITFNNATKTADRFGIPDNAFLFDGSSSYMTVANSASLNPDSITIFAIIKVNGFYIGSCSGNQVLSKGYPYDVNGFYGVQFFDYSTGCSNTPNLNNETFSGIYGDDIPQGAGAGSAVDSVKVKTGQWYYLAYTYDGHTAKFYINGQLKDNVTKNVAFTANANDVFIGKHENPIYPYYLNGVIDEIRIYNRALCQTAISQLSDLKE